MKYSGSSIYFLLCPVVYLNEISYEVLEAVFILAVHC